MKKRYPLLLAVAALLASFSLSSCDDGWQPGPPPGYNNFYDSDLVGLWELVETNGVPVSPDKVNCLEFNGNGRGWYYYQERGVPYEQDMSYWCQISNNGYSDYQVNISYAGSTPSTMNYWFTHGGNYLYLEWYTYSHGVITYVYRSVSSLPYPF